MGSNCKKSQHIPQNVTIYFLMFHSHFLPRLFDTLNSECTEAYLSSTLKHLISHTGVPSDRVSVLYVTSRTFCNLIGLHCALQKEQNHNSHSTRPSIFCLGLASKATCIFLHGNSGPVGGQVSIDPGRVGTANLLMCAKLTQRPHLDFSKSLAVSMFN